MFSKILTIFVSQRQMKLISSTVFLYSVTETSTLTPISTIPGQTMATQQTLTSTTTALPSPIQQFR